MRDGDIYRWYFKPEIEAKRGGGGPWGAYHCMANLAVVIDGVLRDTFWGNGEGQDCKRVDPEQADLKLLGNRNDMTVIREYDVHYYRREDIVSMRHSNNSGAPIYLKSGAKKNAESMREYAQQKIKEAEREMSSAERQIERFTADLTHIGNNNLDAVHF